MTSPRKSTGKRTAVPTSLPEQAMSSPQITFNYPERTSQLDKGTMPLKDDLITPANETIENTDHLFWAESLDPNDYEDLSA